MGLKSKEMGGVVGEQTSMRESFYMLSSQKNQTEMNAFKPVKDILNLSPQEERTLKEIRDKMKDEADRFRQDITEITQHLA